MMRRRDQRRRGLLSGVLMFGIVLCTVLLSDSLHWRLDLTAERSNSLHPATRALLDRLSDRLQLKLYFNRDIEGAEELLPDRLRIQDLLDEIARAGQGRVVVETVDPTTDLVAARDAEHLGIVPITFQGSRVGGVSLDKLYQGLELRYQDRSELIPFVLPDRFEFALASRIAVLLAGGERPVLGFFSREPALPPPVPGIDQQAPEGRVYESLREAVADRYAVRDLHRIGPDSPVPDDLVALVVARPEKVSDAEQQALDDYLKHGGRIVVLYDHEEVLPRQGFDKRSIDSGLDDWLSEFGLEVGRGFVYDEAAKAMPVDVEVVSLPDGSQARNMVFQPFGLYPVLKGDSLNPDHVVTAGLDRVEMVWAHPILHRSVEGAEWTLESLIHSSPRSWVLGEDTKVGITKSNVQLMANLVAQAGEPQVVDLAVALHGRFAAGAEPGVLVLIGDGDLWHNLLFEDPQNPNLSFAMNLFDWLAADESLIDLRSRGQGDRSLRNFYREALDAYPEPPQNPVEARRRDRDAARHQAAMERWIAWLNVLLPAAFLLFAGIAHFGTHRRLARRPWQRGGES